MNQSHSPVRRFLSFPWAITFSDLCIVLLCFFILMASTTRTDPQQYALISESLHGHFGAGQSASNQPNSAGSMTIDHPEPLSVLPVPTQALRLAPGHSDPTPLLKDLEQIRHLLHEQRGRQLVEVAPWGDRIRVQFSPEPNGNDMSRLSYYQDVVEAVRLLENSRDDWSHEVAIYGAESALLDAAGARVKNVSHIGDEDSQAELTAITQGLEQSFKGEREKGWVHIEKLSHSIRVRLGEGGAFAPGDAALTATALSIIDRLGETARTSGARILISGHTDTIPINTAHYKDNWELSAARAISVVRELVNHRGIDPARIEAQGFADTQPLVDNDTPEHRAQNRRIEITLELPTRQISAN